MLFSTHYTREGEGTLDAVVLESDHSETDEFSVFHHKVELLFAIVVVPNPHALHGIIHASFLH